jgi:hypothetical protein
LVFTGFWTRRGGLGLELMLEVIKASYDLEKEGPGEKKLTIG